MRRRGLDCLALVVFSPFGDIADVAYIELIRLPGPGGPYGVPWRNLFRPCYGTQGDLANHRMWLQTQDWVILGCLLHLLSCGCIDRL